MKDALTNEQKVHASSAPTRFLEPTSMGLTPGPSVTVTLEETVPAHGAKTQTWVWLDFHLCTPRQVIARAPPFLSALLRGHTDLRDKWMASQQVSFLPLFVWFW